MRNKRKSVGQQADLLQLSFGSDCDQLIADGCETDPHYRAHRSGQPDEKCQQNHHLPSDEQHEEGEQPLLRSGGNHTAQHWAQSGAR